MAFGKYGDIDLGKLSCYNYSCLGWKRRGNSMDKIVLRTFSIWARRKLTDDVKKRALEIGQKNISDSEIEEIAYAWFKRIIAIRFMEVNGYLYSDVMGLSSIDDGKAYPDIIDHAEYLFIRQCNKLNEMLPYIFKRLDNYTTLFLPNNLLEEGSVIRKLITDISEDDFKGHVEIVGWLYQYYISDKKDEVFSGLQNNIKIIGEKIPLATQFFTPEWIVKYMVENSLGRLWLEQLDDAGAFRDRWEYYLDEASQIDEAKNQLHNINAKLYKNFNVKDIKIIDPAMGSGNILVYAFDVLFDIYKSMGYPETDIPKLILENNLYGLDIDDRAFQLTYFALMMKAASKNRDIFNEDIRFNICSIQESNGISEGVIDYFSAGDESLKRSILYIIEVFEDAKEYGSILRLQYMDFAPLEKRLDEIKLDDTQNTSEKGYKTIVLNRFPCLIRQARIMSYKYHVVCTNPPYLGRRSMGDKLKRYIDHCFPMSKNDLFTVFIEKCIEYAKPGGFISMITQHSWMFLSRFIKIRRKIISDYTICSMVHLGSRAFDDIGGEVVQTTAFVMKKYKNKHYRGRYIRLVDYNSAGKKMKEYFNARNRYVSNIYNFNKIPGSPIAYWIGKKFIQCFENGFSIDSISSFTGSQNITANNDRYLRLWWEVDRQKIGKNKDWVPYSKGGDFRRHYGNLLFVVDWRSKARNFYKNNSTSNLLPEAYWYREGISYTAITNHPSFRYLPPGCVFDKGGPAIIEPENMYYCLALFNSKVFDFYLSIVNPTMNVQVKDIRNFPIIRREDVLKRVEYIEKRNVEIAKEDWDSFEISMDFKMHPILIYKDDNGTLEDAFNRWAEVSEKRFNELRSNEEELNRLFISIYGLHSEVFKDIDERDITIRRADRKRDIKLLISYAVGCMFGRYSMNRSFTPSIDNIIPVLDDEYFKGDIVDRFIEFIEIVFGKANLEENLDYIANSIGRKACEASRHTIRRYFIKEFYKDHVKLYRKRPVYWMFHSGKQDGLNVLIYIHKYDGDTIEKIRTNYLHVLQKIYEAEIKKLDVMLNLGISQEKKMNAVKKKEKIRKQLEECIEYDQVAKYVEDQGVKIDLDDGIGVNYKKFQRIQTKSSNNIVNLLKDI